MSHSILREILLNIKGTLESSSIHALPNIVRNKSKIIKLMWLICFFASFGLCSWFMIKSISDYLNYETISIIKTNYLPKLPFPVVSFCNLNSKFIDRLNITSNNCYFNLLPCDIDKDFEYYQHSYNGLCLRFNKVQNGSVKKYSYGHLNVLSIYFLIDSTDYNIFSYENGLIVFISNENVDSNFAKGIKLSSGFSYDIILNRFKIKLKSKPYSDCIDDLNDSNSYHSDCFLKTISANETNNYRKSLCINMCIQKFVGLNCKIQIKELGPVYYSNLTVIENMPLEHQNCILSSLFTFANSKKLVEDCDCPLECESNGFTYRLSFSHLSNRVLFDKLNFNNSNLSEINYLKPKAGFIKCNIIYEELKETVIYEEAKTHLTDLIANLGGTLGLFLGFSFLSFVELFEIIFQSILSLSQSEKFR